jgi:1-acyl-sn-glycerol-3-phosphate acyltransferase
MTALGNAVQLVRSILFIGQMYLSMAILALVFAPLAIASSAAAHLAIRTYCNWVRFSARWMVGLKSEVRGTIPQGDVLVAAKHQSFFDILILFSVLPRARFVMKKELTRAPFLGWYARRIGCVAVDRGKRGQAVRQMLEDVRAGNGQGASQLVIYPQGTRVPPGALRDYKPGTAILYEALGQACVPAATNVGVFWPKRSLMRRPGTAVVEFLAPIPPGQPMKGFLAELSSRVERESDRLMAEAGFVPPDGEPAGK